MLSKIQVHNYKSLYETKVDLEPLTVFIGPNGSGKSNICESLAFLSVFLRYILENTNDSIKSAFLVALEEVSLSAQYIKNIESKFWQGKWDHFFFQVIDCPLPENHQHDTFNISELWVHMNYYQNRASIKLNKEVDSEPKNEIDDLKELLLNFNYHNSTLYKSLESVQIYDFSPYSLSEQSQDSSKTAMDRTGRGIAYALVDILHANRKSFDELEERLTKLVPNIARITLPRKDKNFELELIDKYSNHHIPASDISDGTLRILAFLVALYQEKTPSIICFEEIENGVHPWLLHKMMELLKMVSTEGINGKPVQILITTHSPLVLNYVEPYQVRAVELDDEGKTQVHALPTDSARFQKALEAYDGELGELWFTNVFGGNPV